VGLLVAGSVAAAAGPERIELEVLVAQISDAPGEIDPKARKLHDRLAEQFRYESLRLLRRERLRLALDELGTVELPNGKQLRVRPLQAGERGALLAVSLGALNTDLRVHNGHLVVIGGAERYQDGKLVVSLEPRW
jgi:hypothetical protein